MDPLLPLLAGTAVALLVGICWAATVAFACWDIYRSALPARQQLKWAALSLIPFIGFALYLARRRELLRPGAPPERETMLRPQPGEGRPGPTVAVAEYARDLGRQAEGMAPATDLASPCLYATTGPYQGCEFVIHALPATIGRREGSTVHLQRDPGVSRQHAELYQRDGMLWLRDLGSTHGTLVNDQPVADQELVPGDTIVVGLTRLVLKGTARDRT